MLQTLRKHDPKEAQRILSSLTSELLPDPEVGSRSNEFLIDPHLYSSVWKEIRSKVKVNPTDASPEVKSKVFEFLFSEMSQIALPRSGLDSVKAKLSFRGELRSDLYDVRFNQVAFRPAEDHGVRPSHVLEAIRNANDVEHMNLLDNEQPISLFLRTHNDVPSRDAFVLLVLGRRVGAYLEVMSALRVYQSDVDISGALRPYDVLRRTVEEYGFFLTIGQITAKLIFDKTVTVEGSLDANTFVKVHSNEGTSVLGNALIGPRALYGSFGIAWAFALDQSKYAADLRRHGVNVKHVHYTEGIFARPEGAEF